MSKSVRSYQSGGSLIAIFSVEKSNWSVKWKSSSTRQGHYYEEFFTKKSHIIPLRIFWGYWRILVNKLENEDEITGGMNF